MRRNNIKIPKDKIEKYCRRRQITELALFGSVLRDDFNSESDVDLLVTFSPDAHYSLFDLVYLREELSAILGYEVDIVEKAAIRNPFRRHHILKNAEVIYAA